MKYALGLLYIALLCWHPVGMIILTIMAIGMVAQIKEESKE